MEKRTIQHRLVLCTAWLLAISMIGGTLAYQTQELRVRNEFQLGKYSTEIVEEFEPPSDWKPGVEVNKDALIRNTGDIPVFARVVLNQKWIRRENIYDKNGKVIAPEKGGAFPLVFDANGNKEYAARIRWGSSVALLAAGQAQEPSLRLGLPTAAKAEDAKGKWLLMSEMPDSSGNYTLYYIGVLKGGESTPLILDGVEMNPAIQASVIAEETVWDKTQKKWITTTTENPIASYENARYTLGVTMHTVQATAEAAKEMFSSSGTTEQAVIGYIGQFGMKDGLADRGRDDSVKEKKLYFEETGGEMRYTPSTGGGNWFMSHLNMLPGQSYEDTMEIENLSKKTYDLYLEAVPLEQSKQADELLDLIHMKVYFGSKLLYEGTAKGKEYSGGTGNLQKAVLLGKFEPKKAEKIKVELTLDKNTPLEYAGILSQIDWKFKVEDKKEPEKDPEKDPEKTPEKTPAKNPGGPKTGDYEDNSWYIRFMILAGTAFAGCVLWLIADGRRRKRQEK